MCIRRAILPVILTLGAAGSILVSAAVPMVAAQASSAHVQTTTASANPDILYHT
jgi:hypothetical protein